MRERRRIRGKKNILNSICIYEESERVKSTPPQAAPLAWSTRGGVAARL